MNLRPAAARQRSPCSSPGSGLRAGRRPRRPRRSRVAAPAAAAAPDDADLIDEEGEETIVVTGQRPRGSVVGDIPPENVLDRARHPRHRRDHASPNCSTRSRRRPAARAAATAGARSCCSTASASRASASFATCRPKRSSGWRSCPRKSRSNMAIRPTSGWSTSSFAGASTRPRPRSARRAATDGGYVAGKADATRADHRDGQRTSLNLRVDGNGPLYESERDIALNPDGDRRRPARLPHPGRRRSNRRG